MADLQLLANLYHTTLRAIVRDGRAPHYSQLGIKIGVLPEEARLALHDLVATGVPAIWLHKGDLIASFAPFSNIPTHIEVSVDGANGWYGQWGIEVLAVSWLYPGKEVQIDCPCLDCGEPIQVRMRDGEILESSPDGIVAHSKLPFSRWRNDMAETWTTINLFRSEEHVERFPLYDPASRAGTIPLETALGLVTTPVFQRRLEPDYLLHWTKWLPEMIANAARLGLSGPFWSVTGT